MRKQPVEEEELLGQAVLRLAGRLDEAEIRLSDYLRLAQLRDEMDDDVSRPVIAGWWSQWEPSRDG